MKKFLDNIGKQGSKLQLKEVEVKFVVNDQDVTSKFLLRPLKVVNRYNLIIGLSIYSFNKKFCPVHSISRVRNHVTCDKFDSSHWLKLPKLCNQVPSLDHFVVQNSGDFLC